MSTALLTRALVVNLLIVSCANAATTKPAKIPKSAGKLADIAPLVDIILGRVGDLFSDSRSPNTAFSNDSYDGDEQIVAEALLDSLQELLADVNGLEKFSLGKRQSESRGQQTMSVPDDLDDTITRRREDAERTPDGIV